MLARLAGPRPRPRLATDRLRENFCARAGDDGFCPCGKITLTKCGLAQGSYAAQLPHFIPPPMP
jgi:hypothetical protein